MNTGSINSGAYHPIFSEKLCDREVAALPVKQNPLARRIRGLSDKQLNGSIFGGGDYFSVYMTTNETAIEETRHKMGMKPQIAKSCHIGCAAWHNFDIMALRHSTYGVIFDFNAVNKCFVDKSLEVLRVSTDRFDFVKRFTPFLKRIELCIAPPIATSYEGTLEEMQGELFREGSWLTDDISFEYIRSMALSDRIATITEDIVHWETFDKLQTMLRENNIVVDTLYISNICSYIKEEGKRQQFEKTVRLLTDEQTLVINCPSVGIAHALPRQYTCEAKELLVAPEKLFKLI